MTTIFVSACVFKHFVTDRASTVIFYCGAIAIDWWYKKLSKYSITTETELLKKSIVGGKDMNYCQNTSVTKGTLQPSRGSGKMNWNWNFYIPNFFLIFERFNYFVILSDFSNYFAHIWVIYILFVDILLFFNFSRFFYGFRQNLNVFIPFRILSPIRYRNKFYFFFLKHDWNKNILPKTTFYKKPLEVQNKPQIVNFCF